LTAGVRELLADYRAGRLRPSQVAAAVVGSNESDDGVPIWITRVDERRLAETARALDDADPALPLYGVPFAVKDNIDVAGLPTTAGCPGYATTPEATAPVVQRLLDAGAMLIAKTNMDQFATGLVGTRSPYGPLSSVFDARRVSGGSSSGSALAVARGRVAFALGTDTAGSGRVPAAFNGLVGLKPTRGLISTRGVVPACASLDCVSILATTVTDAATVFDSAAGYDERDPWSRHERPSARARRGVIGVPEPGQADPEEAAAAAAWAETRQRAAGHWTTVPVDISALLNTAPLLYAAWIAERTADLGAAVAANPDGLDETVATIIAGGGRLSGVDVFDALHRLVELRREAARIWDEIDALLLPTAPFHPTHAQVAADPIAVNERLGRFTNFANLLDLAALAIPGPQRTDGLPFGITLLAPAYEDHRLLELGAQWRAEPSPGPAPGTVRLAVAGAHMSGLPLNGQLTSRGARLVRTARTAARYRLFELPGAAPTRPGLVKVRDGGAEIEVEVWALTPGALGALLCEVPAPLALGRVELAHHEEVVGFVCEGYVADTARDITDHGSWRRYLASSSDQPLIE
jgi:allophanate hydrolase